MIDWHHLLPPESVRIVRVHATQKAAIDAASEAVADACPQLDARDLLEALLQRERLGSTGLGDGVAIPHCRLKACEQPAAALLRLRQAVDFDAPDGQAVDLLFALVVPEGEQQQHLNILAALAATFEPAANRKALRKAGDDGQLRETWLALTEPDS